MKLERLRAYDLPVTWTTLLVGWENGLLPTEELSWYAADHLGKHSGDKAEWIFLLFDAAPKDHRLVRRYLEALANEETTNQEESRRRAERTWNLAHPQSWLEAANPDDAIPPLEAMDDVETGLLCPDHQMPFDNIAPSQEDIYAAETHKRAGGYPVAASHYAFNFFEMLYATRAWIQAEADRVRHETAHGTV